VTAIETGIVVRFQDYPLNITPAPVENVYMYINTYIHLRTYIYIHTHIHRYTNINIYIRLAVRGVPTGANRTHSASRLPYVVA